jgi:hypothetical protein
MLVVLVSVEIDAINEVREFHFCVIIEVCSWSGTVSDEEMAVTNSELTETTYACREVATRLAIPAAVFWFWPRAHVVQFEFSTDAAAGKLRLS